MPVVGFVLFCLGIWLVWKTGCFIIGVLGHAAQSIINICRKLSGGEPPSPPPSQNRRGHDADAFQPGRPEFGIYGACEICGRNFSPVSSASDNHLNDAVFDFYGKRRKMTLCSKCRRLMLEDENCRELE